ncbi:MAG: tRNA (adenosine(37)-N6)-dimethylallyltransferase MiaA, partial [Muribaculaceae bacterium]|nr:tRNA (adenosine(37)-N6)-dimethylallyltransferase MiaA [Muribaculaceae bacterium]
ADSRQIYRHIPIGTAAPTAEEQSLVPHHFVQFKELDEYYSASQFEQDVLELLPRLFERSDYAIMCGGSMMYVDAVCNGIDDIPTISPEVRAQVAEMYQNNGLDFMLERLKSLDPEYYEIVDRKNAKRVVHAVEICLESGTTYTSLRTGAKKERPFRIVKYGITMPREQLFSRINSRVDAMITAGLENEARAVQPLRHLNSLNTVGFKEMFAYFDGIMDFRTACERIKKNTRVYAKKQLTWYAKDPDIIWLSPEEMKNLDNPTHNK